MYRVRLRDIRLSMAMMRDIIRIGLPAGLQSVMYNISNIIVQTTINSSAPTSLPGLDRQRQVTASSG